MGMPDAVLERYEASSIDNKITMLEAYILSLELQISEAATNDSNQWLPPAKKSGNTFHPVDRITCGSYAAAIYHTIQLVFKVMS